MELGGTGGECVWSWVERGVNVYGAGWNGGGECVWSWVEQGVNVYGAGWNGG